MPGGLAPRSRTPYSRNVAIGSLTRDVGAATINSRSDTVPSSGRSVHEGCENGRGRRRSTLRRGAVAGRSARGTDPRRDQLSLARLRTGTPPPDCGSGSGSMMLSGCRLGWESCRRCQAVSCGTVSQRTRRTPSSVPTCSTKRTSTARRLPSQRTHNCSLQGVAAPRPARLTRTTCTPRVQSSGERRSISACARSRVSHATSSRQMRAGAADEWSGAGGRSASMGDARRPVRSRARSRAENDRARPRRTAQGASRTRERMSNTCWNITVSSFAARFGEP